MTGPAAHAQTSTSETTSTTAPPLTCDAAQPGNESVVRWIYIQILNRCPDPGGLTYWTTLLNSPGGFTPQVFARTIDTSNENTQNNNVIPIFEQALNREPTPNELAFWTWDINTERGDATINGYLLSTDEFYNGPALGDATGSARQDAWLAFAYNVILDRDPDSGGATYMNSILNATGSATAQQKRFLVTQILERSQENAEDWVGAVYGAAFNRAPDDAGAGFWVSWLLGPGHFETFEMWTQFLGSPESVAIAQQELNPGPPSDLKASGRSALRAFSHSVRGD